MVVMPPAARTTLASVASRLRVFWESGRSGLRRIVSMSLRLFLLDAVSSATSSALGGESEFLVFVNASSTIASVYFVFKVQS